MLVNAAILNDLCLPALVIGGTLFSLDSRIGRAHRQLSTLPLDSLGSPWYAGPRLSRRLSIAQI